MLTDELKEKTRSAHMDLEKTLLGHLTAVTDKQRYCSLLALMYGYHAAVEARLDAFQNHLPEYNLRRRSNAILNDFKNLSYDGQGLALCTDPPQINSLAHALGALYVLEGSTLGGKIISKMLGRQVPGIENAITFFQGYQENTAEMWQKFKHHLQQNTSVEDAPEVQHAAHETFVKFKHWIDQHGTAKL